jgi:hypothetical protein
MIGFIIVNWIDEEINGQKYKNSEYIYSKKFDNINSNSTKGTYLTLNRSGWPTSTSALRT